MEDITPFIHTTQRDSQLLASLRRRSKAGLVVVAACLAVMIILVVRSVSRFMRRPEPVPYRGSQNMTRPKNAPPVVGDAL